MQGLIVNNEVLVRELGGQARLGKLFAFFDAGLFGDEGKLGWIKSFTPDSGPRVVSLLDRRGTSLPGGVCSPVPLELDLSTVVSDKDLYRESKDTVQLTVVDPFGPSLSKELLIELDGSEFRRVPVTLNGFGLAQVPLTSLPVGHYTAGLEGAEFHDRTSFEVAEYRLAPLVCSLEHHQLKGGTLQFTLELASFGVPVEGFAFVELSSRGRRISRSRAMCQGGKLKAEFPLEGEGPFTLNVQLETEPGKTATVPIPGSRKSERETTVFGRLGSVVVGALLPPDEHSAPVRGIYLQEQSYTNTPFSLERLDAGKARLSCRAAARSVTVVVADPGVPVAGSAAKRPDPRKSCAHYIKAEGLFSQGRFAEARKLLQEGRQAHRQPHGSYAYNIACCFARLSRTQEALSWLRQALRDGWMDLEHMAADADLQTLHGHREFEFLCLGGRKTYHFDQFEAGGTVEIDLPTPLAFLAVGAYVKNEPFEGWSFLLPPSQLDLALRLPGEALPGEMLELTVTTNRPSGLRVVIKDSRLLNTDTPRSRLASRLKACAESASRLFPAEQPRGFFDFVLGHPVDSLWDAPAPSGRPQLRAGLVRRGGSSAPLRSGGRPLLNQLSLGASASGRAVFEEVYSSEEALFGGGDGDMDLFSEAGVLFDCPRPEQPAATTAVKEPAKQKSIETFQNEPEVLYCGVLETRDGSATLRVPLPDNFADYLVEVLAVSEGDWNVTQGRCTVKADPYVSLEVPPFVHAGDAVWGKVLTGDDCEVCLTCDGVAVPLDQERRFLVKPGDYEATVTSSTGLSRSSARRVESPGRLRRLVKSVRILQPGESVALADNPEHFSYRILPGLARPFKTLLSTTADYSHLCCEQTAAKMVSAALIALSGGRDGEAIFSAGVRRLQDMQLEGGGLSMYPGRGGLDTYWGPKAVVYLLSLKGLAGREEFSSAMNEALRAALQIATEGQSAYRISWPAGRVEDCQTAYWSVRESGDQSALRFVSDYLRTGLPAETQAVQRRAQSCYAAATLLHSRCQIEKALELANAVFEQLVDGRLYSTYDSMACIVLMNELKSAGLAGGQGAVLVNGESMSLEQALRRAEIAEVECQEKLCLVEVAKMVEEDWQGFDSTVPIQVSLLRDGRAAGTLSLGDAVDLKIDLERGYKTGDLVWVCLPDCLTRLVGGGQVKRFSVDFEGLDSVTISLAATAATQPEGQQFAVCVRNMFEEERVGNLGLLRVKVG